MEIARYVNKFEIVLYFRKLEYVQTLLKFTRLASGKSLYMIIIGPNSHEDLTKCAIKSGWIRFNHCSKSLVYRLSWKSYLVIIGPNSHAKLTFIQGVSKQVSHCWMFCSGVNLEYLSKTNAQVTTGRVST